MGKSFINGGSGEIDGDYNYIELQQWRMMSHKPCKSWEIDRDYCELFDQIRCLFIQSFSWPLSLNLSEALLQTLNSQQFQTFGQFWTTLLQQAQNNDGSAGAKAQQVWTTLVWQLF